MSRKNAIVTGAGSGIGKGIATYLLESDYHVVLIGRNEKRLQSVIDEANKLNKAVSAETLVLDITNHMELDDKINGLVSRLKRIDILVNSAGYVKRGTTELDYSELRAMVDTNLVGTIDITNHIALIMKKQSYGRIINISSCSGLNGRKELGGYAASKFGLMGFNESLHKELAPHGIYVTAICPNLVDTEMTKDVQSIPREEFVQVNDIVEAIKYLLVLSPNVLVQELVLRCKAKYIKDDPD